MGDPSMVKHGNDEGNRMKLESRGTCSGCIGHCFMEAAFNCRSALSSNRET